MKRRSLRSTICLVAAVTGMTALFVWGIEAQQRPGDAAPAIVRLHVIPHSDHPADQDLKLRVRDDVLAILTRLGTPSSPEAFLESLRALAPHVEARVAERLAAEGRVIPFRVEIGWDQFETRQLAGLAVSEGWYLAMQIVLGEGRGQNFWCVIFPAMCFVPDEIEHLVEPLHAGRVAYAASADDLDLSEAATTYEGVAFRSIVWERMQEGFAGALLRSLQSAFTAP